MAHTELHNAKDISTKIKEFIDAFTYKNIFYEIGNSVNHYDIKFVFYKDNTGSDKLMIYGYTYLPLPEKLDITVPLLHTTLPPALLPDIGASVLKMDPNTDKYKIQLSITGNAPPNTIIGANYGKTFMEIITGPTMNNYKEEPTHKWFIHENDRIKYTRKIPLEPVPKIGKQNMSFLRSNFNDHMTSMLSNIGNMNQKIWDEVWGEQSPIELFQPCEVYDQYWVTWLDIEMLNRKKLPDSLLETMRKKIIDTLLGVGFGQKAPEVPEEDEKPGFFSKLADIITPTEIPPKKEIPIGVVPDITDAPIEPEEPGFFSKLFDDEELKYPYSKIDYSSSDLCFNCFQKEGVSILIHWTDYDENIHGIIVDDEFNEDYDITKMPKVSFLSRHYYSNWSGDRVELRNEDDKVYLDIGKDEYKMSLHGPDFSNETLGEKNG